LSDSELLRVGISLGVAILIAQVATLVSKWVIRHEIVGYLRRSDEIHQRTAALLEAVEGWGESGRAARKDTAAAIRTIAEGPSREDLAKRIDAVPDTTAVKVVEKLADDSVHPHARRNP
jgi:hypothetical protein